MAKQENENNELDSAYYSLQFWLLTDRKKSGTLQAQHVLSPSPAHTQSHCGSWTWLAQHLYRLGTSTGLSGALSHSCNPPCDKSAKKPC